MACFRPPRGGEFLAYPFWPGWGGRACVCCQFFDWRLRGKDWLLSSPCLPSAPMKPSVRAVLWKANPCSKIRIWGKKVGFHKVWLFWSGGGSRVCPALRRTVSQMYMWAGSLRLLEEQSEAQRGCVERGGALPLGLSTETADSALAASVWR